MAELTVMRPKQAVFDDRNNVLDELFVHKLEIDAQTFSESDSDPW